MRVYTDDEKRLKREWYERNKEYVKSKAKERKHKMIKEYQEYKESLSCESCGFSHPAAIQFHHKDSSEKEFNISSAYRWGYSLKRIMEEVSKCEVLCANCHAIRHYNERL